MDKIRAKKNFGQNFISDPNLIKRIVDLLGNDSKNLVIEIGPGQGALTKLLADKFAKVIAIEIDKDMEPILKEKVPNDNFELIIGDALKIDLEKLIKDNKGTLKNVYLISNTPYYITGEILFNTLGVSRYLTKAVFMLQKEVAKRLCAKVNENNYNNLSVACDFYSDTKYEFTVSKGMFQPQPKVDSAIVSLTFNEDNINKVKDDKDFVRFLRSIFNNRRKTILNNLGRYLDDKEKAKAILSSLNIKENLRPENVDLKQFIDIYNSLEK